MTLAHTTGTTDDTAISGVVGQLVDGREPHEAQRLLTGAIVAMNDRATGIARQQKLFEELNAFFVLVTGAFQNLQPNELNGLQRTRLAEAARLAARLAEPAQNNNVFWRCILQTLRAECYYLLGDRESMNVAVQSAQILLELVVANPIVDNCSAYIAELLAGGTPPVTTAAYLDQLHNMLHQA